MIVFRKKKTRKAVDLLCCLLIDNTSYHSLLSECVSVKWRLNYSVLSFLNKSEFNFLSSTMCMLYTHL